MVALRARAVHANQMKAEMRQKGESLRDVFVRRFEIRKPDECWPWVAGTFTSGYGCIRENGKSLRANRVSYELFVGPIPTGLEVCHECDNPICVNPTHLFLSTHDGNMKDAKKKGRIIGLRGEKASAAVLTVDNVIEMRRSYAAGGVSFEKLGKQFGVVKSVAVRACRGVSWAHVPGAIPFQGTLN